MKKLMVLVLVLVFSLGLSTTVMAAPVGRGFCQGFGVQGGFCWELGIQGAGFNFFWDSNGNFLDRETVEANLDDAVAQGIITAAQRDLILERYDWCLAYGCGGLGGFGLGGRCGGLGRMFNGAGQRRNGRW